MGKLGTSDRSSHSSTSQVFFPHSVRRSTEVCVCGHHLPKNPSLRHHLYPFLWVPFLRRNGMHFARSTARGKRGFPGRHVDGGRFYPFLCQNSFLRTLLTETVCSHPQNPSRDRAPLPPRRQILARGPGVRAAPWEAGGASEVPTTDNNSHLRQKSAERSLALGEYNKEVFILKKF